MTEGSSLTDQTFDPPVPAPPKKMWLTLTTKQKQDLRAAILKAVLGGQLLTTDDMFIGTEYGMREKEKQRLTVAKKKHLRMIALEEKAVQILVKREATSNSDWIR